MTVLTAVLLEAKREWFNAHAGKKVLYKNLDGGEVVGTVKPGSFTSMGTCDLMDVEGIGVIPALCPPGLSAWTVTCLEQVSEPLKSDYPHTCRCGAPGLMLFSSFDCSKKCGR